MFLTYFGHIHGVCEVKYNRFCVQKYLQYTVKPCFEPFWVMYFFSGMFELVGTRPESPKIQNTPEMNVSE